MPVYLNQNSSPVAYSFDPLLFMGEGDGSAWWDFGDITTLFQDVTMTTPVTATGQQIAAVKDKGPNGYDLFQPTAAKRPIYTVSGAAKFARFTPGSVQHLASPAVVDLALAQCHGFCLLSTNATTDFLRALSVGQAGQINDVNGNASLAIMSGTAAQYFNFRGVGSTMDAGIAGSGNTPLDVYEYDIKGANSAQAFKGGVSGVKDAAHASPNPRTNGYMAIGVMCNNLGTTTTSPYSGDIYSMMHFGRALSSGECLAIRDWLDANRY